VLIRNVVFLTHSLKVLMVKKKRTKKAEKGLFGKCLGEFTTLGWVWGCSFSPSGKKVAYVSHDSTISYVNWTEENAQPITLKTYNSSF